MTSIDGGADDVEVRLATMYAECEVRGDRIPEVEDVYVRRMIEYRELYTDVGTQLGIPWWFIGVIHSLESTFSMSQHLHNGDPLTARTVNVPKGRPETGSPPFSWRDSALDALKYGKLDGHRDWSIGAALDRLEKYNGLGYRNQELVSPYLWSYSHYYEKGKYVSDGTFDATVVSKQCGGATLIRYLENKRLVEVR